jgi:AcrR family transcriptional regulator
MPKVGQEHLDARRQQIIDAARARFASHGFARTSMADIVTESGLSTGAIYRYFKSKDEIVVAVCDQGSDALPTALSAEGIESFLEHIRTLARTKGHARLTAQVIAEAALNPELAAVVQKQLAELRHAVAGLLPARRGADAAPIAEAFVAVCSGYSQQLAIRDDLDPAPFAWALMTIVDAWPRT